MELDFNLGVAEDPRSADKKALDYKHEDLAGAIFLEWKEKPQTEWKKYTPREQDGSLSCCGQGSAKAMEIMLGKVISAHPPYRSRANFPKGGMWLEDLGQIWRKIGSTTEDLDPSQSQNETTMNRDISVDTPIKTGGYVFVKPKVIDAIAEAIELHKHCILIFHCNGKEWTGVPKYSGQEVNFGHCVCAVDYVMYEGKKHLVIEDSTAHSRSFDLKGQRLISEDFLQARCDGAMYLTLIPPKPKFVFTKTLKMGDIGNDVKMLQLKLNIGADGLFGVKTRLAVIKFQATNGLVPDGIVGKLTNSVLNK